MLECEHRRADGLDAEGMKGDIYENKGQVMAILMVRWRKAGTGWGQGSVLEFRVFLRSPRRDAKRAVGCASSQKRRGHHQHTVGMCPHRNECNQCHDPAERGKRIQQGALRSPTT